MRTGHSNNWNRSQLRAKSSVEFEESGGSKSSRQAARENRDRPDSEFVMSTSYESHHQLCEELSQSLAALESALETPLVSGELVTWLQEVQQDINQLAPEILERVERDHPQLLGQIMQQDLELASHVEHLQNEDRVILQQFTVLRRGIDELASIAASIEPQENKLRNFLQELIQDGIELILRLHKQEVAIDTWYREAFLRIRGVGD
jgi:hypothetical protein